MKNLEIKVKVDNLNEIKQKITFAVYDGMLEQKDIYFLTGDIKIKTREEVKCDELIIYIRKMKKETKISKYYRFPFTKIIFLFIKKLFSFILGIKVIIFKKRELYIYKNTRIHLDVVEGLGSFVELETVCRNSLIAKEYQEEHDDVIQKLDLIKYQSIKGSHSDLLLKMNQIN